MGSDNGAKEAEWVMPKVELGQVVLWTWNAGAKPPSAAIVTGLGQRSINVHIHTEGLHDHAIKTGVRHKDDPFLRRSQLDGGVWELTPRDVRINAMLAEFEAMRPASREIRQPVGNVE